MKDKRVCRMHGGAAGSGAPKGERNGAYVTGAHTQEAIALRREATLLVKEVRKARIELWARRLGCLLD